MTLFPKMDADTADKDEKPDNTNTQDDADQKQDEEFKVLQLFRDMIARFSSEDDKKTEGDVSKEEETTTADENFSPDGLPSRMNSPIPMYGGTMDQHTLAMPEDTGNTGQDDIVTNS
ncbi:uncharacterized protein LOC117103482, partial [Anneissia japonica]|uniref:uncharacterized protein LOC117103482 n=1 Tax=Anneissia japonica TaxID=1529436 RepID=UPI0014258328